VEIAEGVLHAAQEKAAVTADATLEASRHQHRPIAGRVAVAPV